MKRRIASHYALIDGALERDIVVEVDDTCAITSIWRTATLDSVAGVEFYPIKSLKNLLRLHAFIYGNNAKGAQEQVVSFNIGLRWQMKVFQR